MMPVIVSHRVSMEHVSEEIRLAFSHALEILIIAVITSVNAALMMPAIFSQRVSMEHVEESEKV